MHGIDQNRAFIPCRIAVLTVSDTRTLETDKSGDALVRMITEDGHEIADRAIVSDDADAIAAKLDGWIDSGAADVVIATGG
ncbi:MAG: molybdopterin-binding protein, partial [Pseudomonadota bacterium]